MLALTCGITSLYAEDVFVTAFKGSAAASADDTPCPPSCVTGNVSATGAGSPSTATPVPVIPASGRRMRFSGASTTDPTMSWSVLPVDIDLSPSAGGTTYHFTKLQHTPGVYRVYVTKGSTSQSTDIVANMTLPNGTTDGDLANTNGLASTSVPVIAFQSGQPNNAWNFVGYLTNRVDSPEVQFAYASGTAVSSGSRWYLDAVRFEYLDPCTGIAPQVGVSGPLSAGQASVTITGVSGTATNVTVYANGSLIGSTNRASGFAAGSLTVTTTALVKGDSITGTQIATNNLGNACTSSSGSGALVGGGPNPKIRFFASCYKNSTNAGPIGVDSVANGNPYFISATHITFGSAPDGGRELLPGACWQQVTFQNRGGDDAVDSNSGNHITNNDAFCSLEGVVVAIDDADSGPYDIYIDQIKNGSTVVEDFESYNAGTTNTFVAPNVAGNPTASITYLTGAANSSLISAANAYDGSKSCRIQWQWADTNSTRWAHAISSGASGGKKFPQIDTTKPITIRVLVLPVGTSTGHQLNGTPGNINGASPAYTTSSNTLSVSVTGAGPYTYQWSQNGVTLGGATGSSLVIGGVSGLNSNADNGTYSVAISDGTCTETRSATVSVVDPVPGITNQPTAKTIAHVGDNVTLSVGGDGHAAGGYPLNYQWRFNGTNISNATDSSFAANNAQVADAGSYTVVVGNTYGSATSSVAIVDVVQPGVIIGTGTGLRGDYWTSHAYTNGPISSSPFIGAPTLTRTDPTINFNFGAGSPDPSISTDLFTVRWSGQVQALDSDTYTFITTTDDGVRLWVNGQSVIDHWALQGATDRSGTIALTANTKYNILMEYFENGVSASAQLSWSTAGGGVPREIIPQSQLYPASGATHPTLAGAVNNGTNIVFSWGAGTYNLQSSTVVTGAYTTVTGGVVSPLTITIDPAAPQKYYRLQVQ